MSTQELFDMARQASGSLEGIDWDRVKRQGGQTPTQDVYGKAYYIVQLREIMRRVQAMRGKLDLSYDRAVSPEGLQAWEQAKEAVSGTHGRFMAAVNANHAWVSGSPQLHVEVWRAVVTRTYMALVSGVTVHLDIILQLGESNATLIVDSANQIHAACKALLTLESLGYLDPIKKSPSPGPQEKSVSGLGAVPLLPILGIGLVLALAYIAYLLWSSGKTEQLVTIADDICKEGIRTKDKLLLDKCVELRKHIAEQLAKDPLTEALKTGALVLSVGLLAYGGFLLLPHLTKAAQKSRAQKQLPAGGAA